MTKKLLTSAIVMIASFGISGAQGASIWDTPTSDNGSDIYMADSATPAAGNDTVKCWGWDGSKGGNDIKTMTRANCFNMHGTVANHNIPKAEATKKSIEQQ